MPTVMIVLQVLVNVAIILQENIDEVFFYIRENCQGIWFLKGLCGLSLLLLSGMLTFKLQQEGRGKKQEGAGDPDSGD